jgi:D-glycero-alpha-D-manno-heptose 1-phosphate guanylyltransferase
MDTCAVILCGGEGKRLKGAVPDRPKPMAEVGGRPFLDIIIDYLENSGIKQITLCAGYMPGYIQDHYSKQKRKSRIAVSQENEPLGTAGALKHAEKLIACDPFFVLNGDSFIEADLSGMAEFHKRSRAAATILLSEARDARDFGSVLLGPGGKITGFSEKGQAASGGLVNAGVYLLAKKVLEMIPKGLKYSLEYELFPKIEGLYGYVSGKGFIDIGTEERYEKAKTMFKDAK